MAVDPVCGKQVHPKQSQWLLSYQGSTFHFCSGACAHRFDCSPADFAEIEEVAERGSTIRAVAADAMARNSDLVLAA